MYLVFLANDKIPAKVRVFFIYFLIMRLRKRLPFGFLSIRMPRFLLGRRLFHEFGKF